MITIPMMIRFHSVSERFRRAAELVLDEVHDDGIESLLAAVFEILLGLFLGETGDERPRCVPMDQERRATLIHQVAMIRADAKRVGTGRKRSRNARQRGA